MARKKFFVTLLLLLSPPCRLGSAGVAAPVEADPRNVSNGFVIPDEGYCDQPYVVITKDGNWLCVLTTGAGQEGRRGQHVVSTISNDHGRGWSKPVDIEPAAGPEASWATPLVTPSGRVYVFYDYNGDNIRSLAGKPVRADMLGWYCYRYSDDQGQSWSRERYRLPMRVTDCDKHNDWGGSVQIFWGISKPITSDGSALFAFTKLGKHLLEKGEGWFFRSDNLLTEQDPEKLHWETLPNGQHGVRNEAFGSVQEEHNIVSLADGSLYCIYRTTTGHPCQAYSRDGGRNWSEPEVARYAPGGQPIKHPRACPKIWRTAGGKYLLWYHNHGGTSFQDRNPAWICGGLEKDGKIHWSQGEVLLYDDDAKVRMSYPDLIEQDGRYWITETQKTVARVHEIDGALLEGMWREAGLARPAECNSPIAALSLWGEQLRAGRIVLPRLPDLTYGQGLSIELRLRLNEDPAAGAIFDSTDSAGRGLRVAIDDNRRVRLTLADGKCRADWDSDKGLLVPGREHHVVVTVDGGPKLIVFIVDGVVCDGGTERQFGWGRFDKELVDINGGAGLKVSQVAGCEPIALRIYGRCLRNFEAMDRFRSLDDPKPPSN